MNLIKDSDQESKHTQGFVLLLEQVKTYHRINCYSQGYKD